MNQNEISWGLFDDKIPFVRVGTGSKNVVYIRGGEDLLLSLIKNPIKQAKSKCKLINPHNTLYILGYDQNLPPDISFEQIGKDFARIIQENIGETILIGSSLGGLIALYISAHYPDLIVKLILSTSAYEFRPEFERRLKIWIDHCDKGEIKLLLIKMNDFFTSKLNRLLMKIFTFLWWNSIKKDLNSPENPTNFLKKLLHLKGKCFDFLPKIKAETHIIGGTKDIAFSEEIFRKTADNIQNCQLHLYLNYGHEMATEHPKEYRNLIKKLI